jgi:hypothetical protein
MSYKKVQQLAARFIKTAAAIEYYVSPEKADHSVSSFLRNIRVALNELEGDLMTLKYRDFNRTQWKELGNFWRNCIEIYKAFDENKPEVGVKEFTDLLLEKKDWLAKMMPAIHKHLKATEVDFVPGPGLTQARADGLKELIKVINEGTQNVKNNISPAQSVTWRPPAAKSTFVSPSNKTEISGTKSKEEAF